MKINVNKQEKNHMELDILQNVFFFSVCFFLIIFHSFIIDKQGFFLILIIPNLDGLAF